MRSGAVEMKTTIAPHIGSLLFLFWFAGFPAAAGNWKRVTDDEKIRVEVDIATLTRDGNTVKAWERETHRQPEQAKPGDFYFKSTKTLAQHHCVERTTTYLFRGFFAADGSEIKAMTADLGKVDFLIPDSLEERKLTFACTHGAGKPGKPLAQPAPVEAGATAPLVKPVPAKPAEAAKPAEKTPRKDAPPAKSAGKDDKSPVERTPEKAAEAKPVAAMQTSPAPPGKTSAGK